MTNTNLSDDNEQARLTELYALRILDTLPEADFDYLTEIASQICGPPLSLISFIDGDRQWVKSQKGMVAKEIPRELAICAHTIVSDDGLFIVSDTHKDPRFASNPLVIGEPHIRFYAGVSLITDSGYAVGTLCIIDHKPKELTEAQKSALRALAKQAVSLFELKRKRLEIQQINTQLRNMTSEMQQFAYVAAHDLKSPCNNILALAELLKDNQDPLPESALELVEHISIAANTLRSLIDNTLKNSMAAQDADVQKINFSLAEFWRELKSTVSPPSDIEIQCSPENHELLAPKALLMQILLNLVTNAIKYNDKEKGIIRVRFSTDKEFYRFAIEDNGRGISEAHLEKIFDLFHTLEVTDRFNNKGTGIGLNTVRKLVDKLGGTITVSSKEKVGSVFTLIIPR
ncbi:MAG: GAF domain-containing sensor histidine kinase [Bacteroidetes bacterium]|nr:GAF domain-containing sensor histidine kinase [Bacteroidota bacterium]